MTDLDLAARTGLPDALKVLLDAYPRQGWSDDPGFDELIRFWLERHVMFRDVLGRLQDTTRQRLDRSGDPQRFLAELSRYGGFFVNQLHHHHTIEDAHYFPRLAGMDSRIARGFDILDADHHALDTHLQAFVTGANAVLQSDDAARHDAAGRFLAQLDGLEGLLDRHLTDEEDLIVPVILRYGSAGLH